MAEAITLRQVEELKSTLRGNPLLRENVCAQLAVDVVLNDEEFDGGAYPSQDAERRSMEDLAFAVGVSAASYALGLGEVLQAPGSEWPLQIPPVDFADALQAVEQRFSRLNGDMDA